MRIVIFDPVTPKPYSMNSARVTPLGGTEATVVRIAEAINAIVVQHNRSEDEGRYRRTGTAIDPTHLIVLREARQALELAEQYPQAKKFLWLHDLAAPSMDRGKRLSANAVQLAAAGFTIVCVSKFHAEQVRTNFLNLPAAQRPVVTHVYNPVVVTSTLRESMPVDINKLVFFSSPHKGLQYATSVFAQLHSKNPALRLYIANPGYLKDAARPQPGVVNVGAVAHHVILDHVRSALCTFYPNYVYPETFGLALAESNALGTPVLTHSIGAADEVLNGDGQIIRVPASRRWADSAYWRFPRIQRAGEAFLAKMGTFDSYGDRIRSWQRDGRPLVRGRPAFSLENVVSEWRRLFQLDSS